MQRVNRRSLRIRMSWLTRVLSRQARLKRTEINILISDSISYGEIALLSSIFNTVLIDGDRDLVRLKTDADRWPQNVLFCERLLSCPKETDRLRSATFSARLFVLGEARVFVVFDSNSLQHVKSKADFCRAVLRRADYILIGRFNKAPDLPGFTDILELSEMLDGAPSASGMLLCELCSAGPTWIERQEFIVLEYNSSVRSALVAGAQSAIKASLFEERFGLASY